MRKVMMLAAALGVVVAPAFAVKTYQVTGPVLEVSDKVIVVDKGGDSVVSPDRVTVGWTRLTVANYDWTSGLVGGWRVAGGEDLTKAPCDAS